MPPTEVECAYLAGLMDGEGSLTITEHCRSDRPGYIRRNVRVQIYNTNRELLIGIQQVFGGKLYCVRRDCEKWKDQYVLTWAEAQITQVLECVWPYLRLKKTQADILLRYQATKMRTIDGRKNGFSAAQYTKCADLYAQLKQANKRGKNALEVSETG